MAGMADEGAVAFSDDGQPIMNGGVMRRILEYAGMLGKPVINHAEDDGLRNDGLMNEGLMSTRLGLPGNPTQAEAIMVHRDLEIAKLTGAKLHIPHISTASATHHVAEMKQCYDQVTAEVTPHHLYFTDDDLGEYDTNLKVAPPIRGNADRKALINGLKNGTIDCIATDHAPHTIEDKESTFDLAAFGMIGLESCLGAVLKILVQEEGVNLLTVVKVLTVNPRKIMGFETNLLTEKAVAELTIFNPHENWDFSRDNIYSKSINSPYLGKSLTGKVKYTIVKGHLYSY
jgi:dihydroorotase